MNKTIFAAALCAMSMALPSCTCNNKCADNQATCAAATDTTAAVDGKIRLNVFVKLNNQADRDSLISAATRLVEASRNDAGCISYDFLESATVPGDFMIIETWENDSLLQIHSNAPHFTEYVPQIQALGTMTTDRFTLD